MPYSFQGITTMSSALRAFQTQIDVTGENISNSETAGYTRQSVNLVQSGSTSFTSGKTISVGNGVSISAVTRVRDMFLATRQSDVAAKLSRGQESLAGLSNIQDAMAEPGDSGISSAYDAFTNAWSSLSASPGDTSAKADVQQAGTNLVNRVSAFSESLASQASDNATHTNEVLTNIDAKTAQIATLNAQIIEATAHGATPNDLMDMRDSAVNDLSKLADVTVSQGTAGYMVSLNGYRLVDVSGSNAISGKYNATTGKIVDGNTTYPVNGGQLAGTFDTASSIASTSSRLDTFADTLRTQVNALFTTGTTAAGVTGKPFFADPIPPATTTGAIGLQLDSAIAADPNNIPSGTSGLSGDATLASQLSGLRDTKIAALGNATMGTFYANLVSDVGRQTAAAQTNVDTQQAVSTQVDAQVSTTSGVSMDDEMANLLRYQRAYQAAAKALSTFDEMTQTIIGMLNR